MILKDDVAYEFLQKMYSQLEQKLLDKNPELHYEEFYKLQALETALDWYERLHDRYDEK